MDKNRVFAQRLHQSVQNYFDQPWRWTLPMPIVCCTCAMNSWRCAVMK
ncbi:MAG: hypothetical protein ACR5LD_03150 [Symbiopectobacterium sp.]